MCIIRGSAEGYMRGIAINAARIDMFKPSVASIQLRLRVWMVPIDSNVASSNMAASVKPRIQPRRIGDGRLATERECSARSARRSEHRDAGAGAQGPPIIPFGTTVLM